jgi:hypothetical protein
MGLVYRTLVRGAGSDLTFGIFHPMDDGNLIDLNPAPDCGISHLLEQSRIYSASAIV